MSYGTGTLIDVREQYGLVITNWHVVRDATGTVEVVFPCGFRSAARPLKVDADWDLAALVIWRPPLQPIPIADAAPRPGEPLTICGWGKGAYREAVGSCTKYLAPDVNLPREMVELSVEARQGDSGGPILNQQGELAGVLFGAGRGFTLGSFAGRVQTFLTSLAPDIGVPNQDASARQLATIGLPQPVDRLPEEILADGTSSVAVNEGDVTAGLVPIETSDLQTAADPSRPAWQTDRRPGQMRPPDRHPQVDAIAAVEQVAASPQPPPAAIGASQGAAYAIDWNELTQTGMVSQYPDRARHRGDRRHSLEAQPHGRLAPCQSSN